MSQASLLVMLIAAVPGLSGWLDGVRADRVVAAPAVDVRTAADVLSADEAHSEERAAAPAPTTTRTPGVLVGEAPQQEGPTAPVDTPRARRASWRSMAPAQGPPARAPGL